MDYKTKLVKVNKDAGQGSHISPVYMTSTFVFGNAEIGAKRFSGEDPGFMYSRLGNPNFRELEEKVAALEFGEDCLAFSSGMAAITGCLLGILQAGDHVVAHTALYGATHAFLSKTVKKFGIDVTFVPFKTGEEVEPHITDKTKLIYFETPSNPTLSLVDMKSVAAITKAKGVLTVVDNNK